MGLEGGKKKNFRDLEVVQKGSRAALHIAIATFTSLNAASGHNEISQAGGRRFAATLAEGVKMSDTIKPGTVAEDVPKDDPKEPSVKWKIRE